MATAPTTERGTSQTGDYAPGYVVGPDYTWGALLGDHMEHVPELQWKPNGAGAVGLYHKMRTDAQIQGLFLGSTLPIRRYTWYIEPNGARPEVVDRISRDYNIPVRGQEDQPRGRMKRRFSFKNHIRHALLSILYGHMFFEQVGEIGADGKWHIRKLGPRMPQSISDIRLARDGGLKSIVQDNARHRAGMKSGQVELPVNRLIAYVWEQEGGNWTGRSMLRGIYKNWLLKDRVLRVGAINIERAGGVPVITAPRDATAPEMKDFAQMAQQFRVGENSGGAIPFGAELNLAKAAGGDEAVNYVKLQNEEMGRGWLMMFMNLGQTTSGSRALGGSFIDYALNAQETIADFIVDTFNEHMLEDDIDWNEGEQEPAPILGYVRNDDRQLAVADLVQMIEIGVVQVDDELESWIREEYRMPRRNPALNPRTTPDPETASLAVAQRGKSRAADGGAAPPSSGRSRARASAEEEDNAGE